MPLEIEEEICKCNFKIIKTIGVLGPAWILKDLENIIKSEKKVKRIMEIAQLLENEPI